MISSDCIILFQTLRKEENMEILKQNQADLMMVLSGVCGIMAFFLHITDTMSKTRKRALILLELSAMFLLIADRRAYIYRGDPSTKGWVDGADQQFPGVFPDTGCNLLL